MNKTFHFILLLTSTILSTSDLGTDSQIASQIQQYYNNQQFAQMFALITPSYQSISKKDFIADLTTLYARAGPIAYNYSFLGGYNIVAFNNSLLIGYLTFEIYKNKIIDIGVYSDSQKSAVDFFNDKSQKGKGSLSIFFNGTNALQINQNQSQFIGSLSYLTIALEFARQVNQSIIDPRTRVSIKNIEKFHIFNYDIGFRHYELFGGLDVNNTVTLQQIVKGLMRFPSLALAEYLQTLLGLSNLDKMTQNIGLTQDKQYYAASLALSFSYYKGPIYRYNFKQLTQPTLQIHNQLQAEKKGAQKLLNTSGPKLGSLLVTRAINSFAPQVTTFQYASLFNSFHNGSLLDKQTLRKFYEIINLKEYASEYLEYKYSSAYEQLFTLDSGVSFQSLGIFNTVRTVQLQPSSPDGAVQITIALFIQKLTQAQNKIYGQQLRSLSYFLLSSTKFCQDFVSRVHNQ